MESIKLRNGVGKMIENKNQKKLFKWLWITLAIGLFIVTTPIYMPEKKETTTEITSNILVNNVNMVMDSVSYNPNTKDMEAIFYIETNDGKSPEMADLLNLVYTVEVVSKVNNQEYKPKITKVNEQYFVVTIPDVPEKYEFMRFDVTPKIENSNSVNNYQSIRFYYDQNKVKEDTSLKVKDRKGYLSDFVYFKTEQINKNIKSLQKEVKGKESDIVMNKETIKSLESEMLYQIEEEQTVTKGTIESLKNQNEVLSREADQIKETIEQQEERKNLLREKYL